jgi:hypothetical protein
MEPHVKHRAVFKLFIGMCFLLGGAWITFYLFLPLLMEKLLPPLIAEKTSIPEVGLTVRHIGLFSADVEAASLGDKSGPGLIIDTIKIDFSLAGLLKKEIKKIQLSGIRVFVAYQNGILTIPGIVPNTADDSTAADLSSNSGPGFRINRIETANAAAIIKDGDHTINAPFDLLLSASPSGPDHLSGELKAYSYGQIIAAKVDFDLAAATLRLGMATPWLALDQLPAVSDWIKGFEVQNPIARVNVKSSLTFHPEGIKGSGTLEADIGQLPQNHDPAAILAPIRLSGDFAFDIPRDGPWSFAMIPPPTEESPMAQSGGLKIGGSAISLGPLVFSISAKGSASGGQADWRFFMPDSGIKDGSLAIVLGPAGFRGTVSWNGAAQTSTVAVSCQSDPITLKSGAADITLPGLSFEGQFEPSEAGLPHETRFSGILDFSKGSVFLPSSKTAITGISVRLPVCMPCNSLANAGEFSVEALQWDRKNIGSISGTLRQGPSLLKIEGTHRSLLAPGLLVAFTGQFGISANQGVYANLEYKNPSFKTKTPIDLGHFFPEAAGISLEGEIGFSGDFQYGPCGPKGGLTARLLQGTVKNAKAGLNIEGVEAQIHFTDLFSFKSAPNQMIRFASANLGGIQMQKGQIAFQVESFDSIFIEKSGFSWCNGNVDVNALRIKGGVNEYHVDLYCDRLNLAMLLEQFGAANAAGKGAVNGKIPIRYTNGKLLFEDGFLYSTPGQGGTIKIAQTEKLLAEIPLETAQIIQMELAKEALKSYDYDWATLGITTEGEDLLLRMELNGKPTHPLPFIYQKETGGFERIQPGEKGSSFQGINLNMNFRLPLDQMLQYRNVLKKFN